MRNRREQQTFALVFLAPAFILFTVFVAAPALRALGFSLQKWDGLTTPRFVGFSNFIELLRDKELFLQAFWHNLILMTLGGAGIILLSLTFAALIHRRIRGAGVFRVTFFFPNVLSSVAIALLWVLLYSPTTFGLINNGLIWLQGTVQGEVSTAIEGLLAFRYAYNLPSVVDGLAVFAQSHIWYPDVSLPFPFTVSRYLIYSIVPMMIWTSTGFYMVLFLAGMEGIPETFYEAAKLDGASDIAQFRHITLPLIREILTVGLVFLVIGSLKFFDAIWIMENQWPRPDSHVLATLLYQKVFTEYNVGYGSAVAVVLFILVFLATLVTLRLSRKEALEY